MKRNLIFFAGTLLLFSFILFYLRSNETNKTADVIKPSPPDQSSAFTPDTTKSQENKESLSSIKTNIKKDDLNEDVQEVSLESIGKLLGNEKLTDSNKERLHNSIYELFASKHYSREEIFSYFEQIITNQLHNPEKIAAILELLTPYKPAELNELALSFLDSYSNEILLRSASNMLISTYSDWQINDHSLSEFSQDQRIYSPASVLFEINSALSSFSDSAESQQALKRAHRLLADMDTTEEILSKDFSDAKDFLTANTVSMEFFETFLSRPKDQARMLTLMEKTLPQLSQPIQHQLLIRLNEIRIYESSTLTNETNEKINQILLSLEYRYEQDVLEKQALIAHKHSR
ncbi:hypothetical protein [Teredinibacter sp. KSP-S5-2]|uniref:hypothetical protein n=1 Tax=Teredinibacter sp. KSP-S5-2 TaxID=3034506 RepID=UPI002934B0EB|nr:hypothetical protein [Teredinibacter sp. KSP-S5-2]WNO11663.1 hypothetical protein P5V12_10815 [Teredinibacter sp. KSP-S5-2]